MLLEHLAFELAGAMDPGAVAQHLLGELGITAADLQPDTARRAPVGDCFSQVPESLRPLLH